MAILTQKKYLNVIPGISPQLTVHCSQNDTGSAVDFLLFAGSEPFEPVGAAIGVTGVRRDGTGFGPNACTYSGNTVTVTIDAAMTAVAGPAICELIITESSGTVSTANFAILVEEAAFPNGPLVKNSVDVYQQILAYVQGFVAEVDPKISNETAARMAADNVLQAQIDQLIAPSGEAPSAAEVENARIGADGITYSTLGDAIRGQITAVSGAIDKLLAPVTFDYTTVTKSNFAINSSGVWSTGTTQKSYSMPLSGIKKVSVTSNADNSVIAFLKSYEPVALEAVDFSANFSSRIMLNDGESKEFFIYGDMNYLFALLKDNSGNDKTPTVLIYYTETDPTLTLEHVPADAKATGEALAVFDRSVYTYTHDYTADAENNWVIAYRTETGGRWQYQNTALSRSKTFRIPDNAIKLTIEAGSENAVITCLKSYNPVQDETPDFSEGWVRTLINAGNSMEFYVADDCKYLYATSISTAGVGMLPTVTINAVKENNSCLAPVDSETEDETGKFDMTDEIALALSRYGICKLSKGIYYVRGGIQMPVGSSLVGEGADTIIKLLDTATDASTVVMNSNCTIRDLTIKGAYSTLSTSSTIGTRNGIEWTGEELEHSTIENCIVRNFDGAGIYLHDTTTKTYRCLAISDCFIANNNVGIDIRKNSEFNRIANCTIYGNYIGYRNRGGNNNITNCGIDANTVGIQIDADEGSNGGHGTISSCSINHTNHNNGYGLIVDGTGRMLVSNCNFYFSKILLSNTNGNVISNCGFGQNAAWEITGGECSLFIGCMVRGWSSENSPVTITENTQARIINCYDRDGNAYA